MYKLGKYTGTDKMCDLIAENYPMLLVLSRFNIALGFGDQSIAQVCTQNNVDVVTFLTIVNLLADRENTLEIDEKNLSVEALIVYLQNSHDYFLNFRLPAIRKKLAEAIDSAHSDISFAVMNFFDQYAADVRKHMQYEEKKLFPYIHKLLEKNPLTDYSIATFSKQHDDNIETNLSELKNILIKYYPANSSNELNGVLFDIFTCEQDLASHILIEDKLMVPLVEKMEQKVGKKL